MDTEKLYSFLLVDEEILKNDSDFEDYYEKKAEAYEKKYSSLMCKFGPMLSVFNKYKGEFKIISAKAKEKQEECDRKFKEYDARIKKIMEDYKITSDDFNLVLRSYAGVQMVGKEKIIIDALDTYKDFADAMNSFMRLCLEREIDKAVFLMYKDIIENCEIAGEIMENLEKVFYDSYGFWASYDKRTAYWRTEEEDLITMFNLVYQTMIQGDEDRVTFEYAEEEKGEEWDIAGRVMSQLGVKNIEIGEDIEPVDRYVIEFLIETAERWKKEYSKFWIRPKRREESEGNSRIIQESKATIQNIIIQLAQKDLPKEKSSLRESEFKYKKMTKGFIDIIKDVLKEMKELEQMYNQHWEMRDEMYEKLVRYRNDLEKCVEKYEKYEKVPDRKKTGISPKNFYNNERRKYSQNRKDALIEALNLIMSMCEDNYQSKESSLRHITNEINAAMEEDDGLKETADIKQEFPAEHKELFTRLKKEMNGEMMEKEENNEKYGNGMFEFGKIGIITLTFPNTEIKKYKTAAIIVDIDDMDKLIIRSKKGGWNFRGGDAGEGRDAGPSYHKKTFCPDRVLAYSGRENLAKIVMGDSVIDKKYFFKSHKFDWRKDCIGVGEDNCSKQRRENYYQGKIRIGGEAEFDEAKTVCVNNGENDQNASILYFDDGEKLKEFLKGLEAHSGNE